MTTPTIAELREAWPIGQRGRRIVAHSRLHRASPVALGCITCAFRVALDHADALQRDNEWRGNKLDQWAQENAALEAENAELKRSRTIADEHLHADTERLDWLSVEREGNWPPFQNQKGEWWIVHRDDKLSVGPEPTLRAAIDAARRKP